MTTEQDRSDAERAFPHWRKIDDELNMSSTTQPPRTQARLLYLVNDSRQEYDDHVRVVQTVIGTALKSSGKTFTPSSGSGLGTLPSDPDRRREEVVRPLSRQFSPGYGDADGTNWSCGSGLVPSLVLTLNGAERLRCPKVAKAQVQAEVNYVSGLGAPDGRRSFRIDLQQYRPECQMALAVGLGSWVETYQRAPSWTCLLVDVATRVAALTVLSAKGLATVARPNDPCFSPPAPDPDIAVPAYSAYPAGHPAVVAAVAEVLKAVRNDAGAQALLQLMAADISLNRVWARLHTRLDIDAGWAFGKEVGAALLALDPTANALWAELLEAAKQEWT